MTKVYLVKYEDHHGKRYNLGVFSSEQMAIDAVRYFAKADAQLVKKYYESEAVCIETMIEDYEISECFLNEVKIDDWAKLK